VAHTAFIALGSNLGQREEYIHNALFLLKRKGVSVQKCSQLIETEPVGFKNQPPFLNGVCQISTSHTPHELLAVCQSIEKDLGRKKTFQNAPRVIDLDILLYNNDVVSDENLIIPHPRMWERSFVINPLKEIAPEVLQRYDAYFQVAQENSPNPSNSPEK
jgi:2-amino-4-hydroxy-6-hydroxymethyldihydropteridine diphosphokinase